MKNVTGFVLASLFSVSSLVSAASAYATPASKSVLPPNKSSFGICDYLLRGAPSSDTHFDFMAAELEELYLDVVDEHVKLNGASQEYLRKNLERVITMKAEFLNNAMPVVRTLREREEKGEPHTVKLSDVYAMITSLGAPVEFFIEHVKPFKASAADAEPEIRNKIGFDFGFGSRDMPSNPQGFIGFFKAEGADDKVPAGSHRSIGFGPQTISQYPLPTRVAGQVEIQYVTNLTTGKTTMVVRNTYSGKIRQVPMELLRTAGGQTEEKAFIIIFDGSEYEWVLNYQSLVNPEGILGFQFKQSENSVSRLPRKNPPSEPSSPQN